MTSLAPASAFARRAAPLLSARERAHDHDLVARLQDARGIALHRHARRTPGCAGARGPPRRSSESGCRDRRRRAPANTSRKRGGSRVDRDVHCAAPPCRNAAATGSRPGRRAPGRSRIRVESSRYDSRSRRFDRVDLGQVLGEALPRCGLRRGCPRPRPTSCRSTRRRS